MFPLTYICVPAQNMFSEGLGANLSLSPKSVKTCSVVEHRCPAAKLTRNTGPHVCEPGCALIYAQIKMIVQSASRYLCCCVSDALRRKIEATMDVRKKKSPATIIATSIAR